MKIEHPVLLTLSVLVGCLLLNACEGGGAPTTSGTGARIHATPPPGAGGVTTGAGGATGGTGGVSMGTGGTTGGTGGVATGGEGGALGGTGGVSTGTGGTTGGTGGVATGGAGGTGGVATGTGGTGGSAAPAGACTGIEDVMLLTEATKQALADAVIACGQKHLGKEPATLSCILAIGMSMDCAQCVDTLVHCTIENCLHACLLDPTGAACVACRVQQCDPAFTTCSGITIPDQDP